VLAKDNQAVAGHNLFVGSQRYIGAGPSESIASKTPEAETTVEVEDIIAIIPKAPTPMILRPCQDGTYKLVGASYIGCLYGTPLYKSGVMPDLIPFRIR